MKLLDYVQIMHHKTPQKGGYDLKKVLEDFSIYLYRNKKICSRFSLYYYFVNQEKRVNLLSYLDLHDKVVNIELKTAVFLEKMEKGKQLSLL